MPRRESIPRSDRGSWWIGLSREDFAHRVTEHELERMQLSRYGSPWADAGRRINGVDLAESRKRVVKPRVR